MKRCCLIRCDTRRQQTASDRQTLLAGSLNDDNLETENINLNVRQISAYAPAAAVPFSSAVHTAMANCTCVHRPGSATEGDIACERMGHTTSLSRVRGDFMPSVGSHAM